MKKATEDDITELLSIAREGLDITNGACNGIKENLEKYFEGEIDVFHQQGDGFVVLYNTESHGKDSNLNHPVSVVVKNIKFDENHYRDLIEF